ncbi:hypothetical protein [Pseudodesulfovibrio sp. zrk46]|uniref:hypothetical protein n=1 Tax=Pseudodesulfovibrio sp. zrk46 TaxID=2725288 RepID=UPI001448AC23|nr:hypothetical protein [Pseudodesulfovibrio sp. zrk46]QJB55658.1 hypothetical protein HFN16_04260 [Pseudodesulfovibrio sp. zrk46]
MPFTCNVKIMESYLAVAATGTLASVQEVEEYVAFVRERAKANKITRVLLDERNLMDQQDTLDAYDFSESDSARMTAQEGIRLASVCHPDNYEINKTYETLLLNRSLVFRVFLEEKEALEWLLS